MPLDSQVGTSSVEAVAFSFMTDQEILNGSFVTVTETLMFRGVGRPVLGGLHDPAFGSPQPFRVPCTTCGLRDDCPGHFGHIPLVAPVYNPLMFNFLSNILKKTCFFCHHFMASRDEVERRVSQLKLILEGNITKAKSLDESKLDAVDCDVDDQLGKTWTSLQFSEAMSVLTTFLHTGYNNCQNCGKFSPKITEPNFGCFHMEAPSDSQARENDITEGNASFANKRSRILSKKLIEKTSLSGPLMPSEVTGILQFLWENESKLCSYICDIQNQGFGKKAGHSMFFLENIFVAPIQFRPLSRVGNNDFHHPQTSMLGKVLEANNSLGEAYLLKLAAPTILTLWKTLQQSVNLLFDNRTASKSESVNLLFDNRTASKSQPDVTIGICQLLEDKKGTFREEMMGKMVDFAFRSVISPDPYLAVNEIGIPQCFALRLTYPERVTPWNEVKLMEAVINGPETHPGANFWANQTSMKMLPLDRRNRVSTSRKLKSSSGIPMYRQEFERKVVHRHLKDGDVVLVNRQPTLHKPSIMAHVVRVLPGEKTVRMHYANCSTYNADFDGDEINVHFPQDEISRAEAYNLVNANNQYVKPTNGYPTRALIQDHIVGAVLLTKKDTFFSWEEFNQLLYSSGVSMTASGSVTCKPGNKLIISKSNSESEMFDILPPAIFKPERLWTGKQVISALLCYITKGHPPFTVKKNAKIPSSFFNDENEDKLLIFKNELVRGVVDKAQFGDYGMVHTVQEFYGSNTAGILLSALSRLLTNFLQMHGFTCGIDDLLLLEGKDSERINQLESCEEIGDNVHREFIGVMENDNIDPITMQLNVEKKVRSNGEAALTCLDRKMISNLNSRTSSGVLKELLSKGILKPSKKNWISLMTESGAKGSVVNFQQISSHLGQQVLEGKRVPHMVSGKTLPCFPSWDCSPRAGGFIIDRFLTALRPQEYYFHCMAGREGLVDTAAKTSRSGYLQRCLVKNLECLKVCYDHTVRDADGSVIQFHYGEDGVDVHQTSFITKFEALSINKELVYSNVFRRLDESSPYVNKLPDALKEKAENFISDSMSMIQDFLKLPDALKEKAENFISYYMPMNQEDFLELMEHKYVSSLAQPGDPVGVLAAQSVGEPATQMGLNTFRLAGQGEMNVTLGIPRLHEILVAASDRIKTPFMSCPLRPNRIMEDAIRLADKMKKITVADIIESMEVSFVIVAAEDNQVCSTYKLRMKLHKPKHYSKYTDVTFGDWEETLRVGFVRELEDAIESHITLLKSGITNFQGKNGVENDHSNDSESYENGQTDDDDGDDTCFDAQKSKQQAMDEVYYDDGPEEEKCEMSEDGKDDEDEKGDGDDRDSEVNNNDKNATLDASNEETSKSGPVSKKYDRRVDVKFTGTHFEIRFKFTAEEPHILLAEIAQRTAKKVWIQNLGKVVECKAITCKESGVIYYDEVNGKRIDVSLSEKEKIPALQASGIHFKTFWEMEDFLNLRYVYSNDVHAILRTYGVEAAKEIIIREVQNVFKSYGISVNIRHLILIADYMTHAGGYRPLNIKGIEDSTSPLFKMSFDNASKFIVEAAHHGLVDTLETPSSRICLGLPVKMGTGCLDLMQSFNL